LSWRGWSRQRFNWLDFNKAYDYPLNEFRQNHEYYAKRWNES